MVSITYDSDAILQDEIAPAVVPYIAQNIQNPDWHYRDAACVAFGG